MSIITPKYPDRPLSAVQFPTPACPKDGCGFPTEVIACNRKWERLSDHSQRLVGATEELACLSPICGHRWIQRWGTGGEIR